MRNVLVANVFKPFIHNFKVLGGGKLEYCKSMGQPQKGEPKFEISEGGSNTGDTIFDSNLVVERREFWRELCHHRTLGLNCAKIKW